jgi:hypothetical protein
MLRMGLDSLNFPDSFYRLSVEILEEEGLTDKSCVEWMG